MAREDAVTHLRSNQDMILMIIPLQQDKIAKRVQDILRLMK